MVSAPVSGTQIRLRVSSLNPYYTGRWFLLSLTTKKTQLY